MRSLKCKVQVQDAEKDGAQAMARVKTYACPPDGGLPRDDGRDFLHALCERGVSRMQLFTSVSEKEVQAAEQKHDSSAG